MSNAAEASTPRRAQLRQPRLADMVASVLRDRIVNGELGNGDLLPKQDELLEEFRISRPSLREALRILESEGLLTVRRGNVGGSVVEAPNAESSAYMFGSFRSTAINVRPCRVAETTRQGPDLCV